MPRSRRPRRRGHDPEPEPLDVERILGGARHTEVRRDGTWNVQPQSAAAAAKDYSCPGCGLAITPGTAHLVAWRADGLFGGSGQGFGDLLCRFQAVSQIPVAFAGIHGDAV